MLKASNPMQGARAGEGTRAVLLSGGAQAQGELHRGCAHAYAPAFQQSVNWLQKALHADALNKKSIQKLIALKVVIPGRLIFCA